MTYREEVLRTAGSSDLAMGALGLAGETGELVDIIKKHLYHGKALDRTDLVKELGDIRWYLEYLMIATGVTMEEVEATNVAKLRKRYPEGFSFKAAAEKADTHE